MKQNQQASDIQILNTKVLAAIPPLSWLGQQDRNGFMRISGTLISFGLAAGLADLMISRVLDFRRFSLGSDLAGQVMVFTISIVILHLVLVIHEGGHIIGAQLVGFRFLLMIVGPLKVSRKGRGIQIRANKKLALYWAFTAFILPNKYDLRRQKVVLAAAGPLASFLLTITATSVLFGLYQLKVHSDIALSYWIILTLWLIVVESFEIFVMTVVPLKIKGFVTDGATLISLLKNR